MYIHLELDVRAQPNITPVPNFKTGKMTTHPKVRAYQKKLKKLIAAQIPYSMRPHPMPKKVRIFCHMQFAVKDPSRHGELRAQTPDCDNCFKLIGDCLGRIIYSDSQIVDLRTLKTSEAHDRIDLHIELCDRNFRDQRKVRRERLGPRFYEWSVDGQVVGFATKSAKVWVLSSANPARVLGEFRTVRDVCRAANKKFK